MIEQINSTTYRNLVDWPLPNQTTVDIDVEIGGADPGEFFPEVKIAKWGNQCHFGQRLQGYPGGVTSFDGATITYTHPDIEITYTDTPDGFIQETKLLTMPPAPELTYSLDIAKLTAEKQQDPSLYAGASIITDTDGIEKWHWITADLGDDAYLPLENVNSYVFFFDTVGGKYETGVAFRLYRPKAIDNAGNEVWCDQTINNPLTNLKVLIPQSFLDDAQANGNFPVRIV